MPALKMKAKPGIGCLREGQNLHVCRKQDKISKSPRLVKISQRNTAQDDCFPHSQDACSEQIKPDEALDEHDLYENESDQVSGSPNSTDSASTVSTDSQLASCPSILETFFSPIIEDGKVQDKPTSDRHVDVDDEQADFHILVTDNSDDGSCRYQEYKSCSFCDYLISDFSNSNFSFDGGMGFYELINSAPDYDPLNFDLMLDMDDDYLMLPISGHDSKSCSSLDVSSDAHVMSTADPFKNLTVHQLKRSEQEADNGYHFGDGVSDSFDPYMFIRNISEISEAVSSFWPVLPKEIQRQKSVTLVLDLDETLVHSSLEHCDSADFTFPLFSNMKEHTVYVKQRPYLHIFLERVAEMFEIVIFTASQRKYAEPLLDKLDPNKNIISRRMYRDSCIFFEGNYTKDLTILGLDLAKVAIIDNSPQVFRLQVNNGIPIKSWFDDPSDSALILLLPFLETLANADDVRPIIAQKFSNKEQ